MCFKLNVKPGYKCLIFQANYMKISSFLFVVKLSSNTKFPVIFAETVIMSTNHFTNIKQIQNPPPSPGKKNYYPEFFKDIEFHLNQCYLKYTEGHLKAFLRFFL